MLFRSWLQLILVLILIHICQILNFFNYRTTYYLYGIVVLFIVNIINEETKQAYLPPPSSVDKYMQHRIKRDKDYKNCNEYIEFFLKKRGF